MYKWKDELISARLNTAIKSQTISSNTVRATLVASKVFWSQKTAGGCCISSQNKGAVALVPKTKLGNSRRAVRFAAFVYN